MAANGFIELLRLSKRGNKNYASVQNEAQRWSGIAFEMRGQYFVAPLGEVSEVMSRDWQTFVEDYFRYLIWLILFQGSGVHFRLPKKCCVLAIMTSMWGWLWIRFWGFSTLIKKVFFLRVQT